ncbi:MarR family transcriptional regulator [Streptomyces sp. NPDC056387]|uniref:MarR family transcriptional regulator n=1 Tax=Streptomyces sp. NPDC056387 TaxID=3345803 RepID=UPI0035DBD999
MTSTAPLADARLLGLAHYAARGLLEHVLSRHGITFTQQVALRAAITADTPQTPQELSARIHDSLKTDSADIHAVLDELLARQLLTLDGAHIHPTDTARELLTAIGADTAPVTARVWGGIPAEDLAAAGRVLALVTERANAELAALST